MIFRTILHLTLWLSLSMTVAAQEAQVQRFFLDPTDLEGQVRERLDGNGDRCALIKVQSAIPCEFNGDIVGNVAKVKGSYMVYVCAKDNFTRSIDIIPEGYLPMTVTFADFGINEIKGGQTYILRINSPILTSTEIQRIQQEPILSIIPSTKDCFILIDDKFVGTGSWSGRLSARQHKIECMKDGFLSETAFIRLNLNDSKTIQIPKLKPYGYLTVPSIQKIHSIWIDDERVDASKQYHIVESGVHKLKIWAAGYDSYTTDINISSGEVTNICWDFSTKTNGDLFTSIEEKPSFPGGEAELMRYISNSMHYPSICQENSICGIVPVHFRINKQGEVDNVTVSEQDINPDLKQEAIRVIKSLPHFFPGKMNGIPVNVHYSINVVFNLQ